MKLTSFFPFPSLASSITTKLLSVLNFIGWSCGCVTINLNKRHESILRVKLPFYKNYFFYYALSHIILHTSITLAYFIFWAGEEFSSPVASELITGGIFTVTWIVSNFLRRLFWLVHPTLLLNFFVKFDQLEKNQSFCLAKHKSSPTNCSKLICFAFLVSVWRVSLEIYASLAHSIELFMSSSESESKFLTRLIVGLFGNWTFWSSQVFSNGLPLLCGYSLLERYQNYMEEFLNLSTLSTQEQSMSAKDRKPIKFDSTTVETLQNWQKWTQNFQCLQEAFDLFGKLVGFLLIVGIVENSIYGIVLLNEISFRGNERTKMQLMADFLSILEGILFLHLTADLGQRIKNVMKEAKAEVKSFLVRSNLMVPSSFSVIMRLEGLIGNFILKWNWELSAIGMFNVDHKLIPMILGTTMTYVMFIYQLKTSEDASGLRVSNS